MKTLIIGGGVAGLSCARTLAEASSPYLLAEKENELGGLCRTVFTRGFTFDYTGHFLHFQKPGIEKWVLSLVDRPLRKRYRHAAIYSQGIYSEYPYQENNAGLPSSTVRENVLGALESVLHRRFGGWDLERTWDFKSWCLRAFGKGVSGNFMFPYNEKLWKFPLGKLSTLWMGRFVPFPRVSRVIQGALKRQPSVAGYNATFLYPEEGGISLLPHSIARGLPRLWTRMELNGLDLEKHKATFAPGLELDYDYLVSSLPLPLLAALTRGLPFQLRKAAYRLKATSVYNINYGVRGSQPIPYSWVYFPEKEFGFHRAGSVSACVPGMAPKGHFSLYVEFSYRGGKPDAKALGRHAVEKLIKLKWIRSQREIVVRVDLNLPGAYVIYDQGRKDTVSCLLKYYRKKGVFSVGRYGRWEYGTMESAMEQGMEAARTILGN